MTHRRMQSAEDGAGRVDAWVEFESVIDSKGPRQADIAPKIKRLCPDDNEQRYANERAECGQDSNNEAVDGVKVAKPENEKKPGQHSQQKESAKKDGHRLALFQAFLRRINCFT